MIHIYFQMKRPLLKVDDDDSTDSIETKSPRKKNHLNQCQTESHLHNSLEGIQPSPSQDEKQKTRNVPTLNLSDQTSTQIINIFDLIELPEPEQELNLGPDLFDDEPDRKTEYNFVYECPYPINSINESIKANYSHMTEEERNERSWLWQDVRTLDFFPPEERPNSKELGRKYRMELEKLTKS